jgi:hypothetical protein
VGSDSRGIVVIKELFSKDVHKEIISFVQNEVNTYPLDEDNSLFFRRCKQNIDFFVHIHEQLVDLASECFQVKLKPSYSFLSMYEDKGRCPLHLDRPPCYRTIDYLINSDSKDGWPINISHPWSDDKVKSFLGKKSGLSKEEFDLRVENEIWESIILEENDAAGYSGTNSWHYRPTLSNGKSNLVFFHFVKEDYDGELL